MGNLMAIEKCINHTGISEVIFEEGLVGHEFFVVITGKIGMIEQRRAQAARHSCTMA